MHEWMPMWMQTHMQMLAQQPECEALARLWGALGSHSGALRSHCGALWHHSGTLSHRGGAFCLEPLRRNP